MFSKLEFGPKQRATIAAAMTLSAALALIAAIAVIIWGIAFFATSFKNVLLPPAVAGILAMLLRPYYNRLLSVCRGSHAAGMILFFLSALIPIGIFCCFAGYFFTNQLVRLFDDLPTTINKLFDAARSQWPQVAAFLEKYGLLAEFGNLFENPGEMAAKTLNVAGRKISQSLIQMFQSVAILFAWFVTPVYLAFFLMARKFETGQIAEYLPFLKKETREDVIYLVDQFAGILVAFFRGQIIIALAQGLLYAVGFALAGLPYGFVIGIMLGFLNIIPYLGSIAGLGLTIPLAYFGAGGSAMQAISVLVVFLVVQVIEGYILTPRIMGDSTGLHPALIVFSVFFWGAALDGILGMMLAVPLTAFAVVFGRLLKKKYISEMV